MKECDYCSEPIMEEIEDALTFVGDDKSYIEFNNKKYYIQNGLKFCSVECLTDSITDYFKDK